MCSAALVMMMMMMMIMMLLLLFIQAAACLQRNQQTFNVTPQHSQSLSLSLSLSLCVCVTVCVSLSVRLSLSMSVRHVSCDCCTTSNVNHSQAGSVYTVLRVMNVFNGKGYFSGSCSSETLRPLFKRRKAVLSQGNPNLIIRVITFELTQQIRTRYVNVTDRQTDGRLTVAIPRDKVHRAVKK